MSDSELDAIRRKKLRRFQKKLAPKKQTTETIDADQVLNRIFQGRAWEVFNAANYQFPHAMIKVKEILVKLALSEKLKTVTGEQLYLFLRKLGLKVKLNTKINIESHGQLISLEEKIRESTRSL
jgi:DNA-binding TFAR19-related protein (PDSD5 family)